MQDSQERPAPRESATKAARPAVRRRLSVRLLWITILAVMLAEVLIFVPSIANFRQGWLRQKIETAAVAGLASEQAGPENGSVLGPAQQASLLRALDADLIALSSAGVSRLLARAENIGVVDRQIDLAAETVPEMISGAFGTLFSGADRTLRIFGPVGDGSMVAEVVMPEKPLRAAMLRYSRNIAALSLAIALFAALLVYAAISLFLIRPIRAMTQSMVRFAENPEDPDRIIAGSGRDDEIGVAEAELAGMQARLARTLREQRHLADLGLAVSKINHDLRNILASAQLVSDRLSGLPDPRVQRFTPMLLRSLDRALTYTQSVLAYGKAVETPPVKRKVRLRRLVADVYELLAVPPESGIVLANDVPEDFEVEVDPGQFFRALANLCRNAVQALDGEDSAAVVRRVGVGARHEGGEVLIFVEDTGPGLPERARENLFKAFKGSARSGGTGLGLAIAAEIVQAHGGRIQLSDSPAPGARFEIRLPRRPGQYTADNQSGDRAA